MKPIFRETKNLRKSNAPWAGNVPDYWSAASLRWKARIYAGGTPDKSKLEFWENGNIPWLNSGSVNQYVIKKPSALITEEALKKSSTRWVPKRALLLALAGQGKTKGMVARLAIDSTCNQSVAAIVPNWDLNGIFLHYFLQDNYQNIRNLAGGDLRDGLNLDMLASISCPMPPLSEQRSIAAYLNRETAKIDKLIARQQKLIKLLQEKRQAVISQAVTKGLDLNVKMKDSGVEWLGEVPADWTVVKLGRIVFMQEGPGLRHWQFTSSGVKVICVTNITDSGIDFEKLEKFISLEEYESTYRHFRVRKGDLLISSSGNSWGKIASFELDEEVILNTSTIRINGGNSNKIHPKFIKHILQSNNVREQLGLFMTGACQPNFGPTHLSRVIVALPPLEQQVKTAQKVEEKLLCVENLIKKANATIELLREHRQALITAAVTGKIDVRGLVTDEEVAALDEDPVLETTEEDFESEVAEADYITEEE